MSWAFSNNSQTSAHYCYRPIVWGPLSEFIGRRIPLVVACFGCMVFQFAVAVSKDLQSVMINRFFAGFFGVSFLTISGAVCADLFDSKTRGLAVRPIDHKDPSKADQSDRLQSSPSASSSVLWLLRLLAVSLWRAI